MKVIAIIGMIPFCVEFVSIGGVAYLFVSVQILWVLGQIQVIRSLIRDEIQNGKSEMITPHNILDNYRVKGKNDRKYALVLSLLVLPFTLALILTPEHNLSVAASFYLVGGIANLCDGYFRACIDLPKGKSVFTRAREWLRNFAKQSVPQAT